jgi:hypothetical protein
MKRQIFNVAQILPYVMKMSGAGTRSRHCIQDFVTIGGTGAAHNQRSVPQHYEKA